MSGVDVLAVLDDLVADMGDTPGTTGQQVAQARAAVAELIEALNELYEADADRRSDGMRTVGMDLRSMSAEKRLAAALANVTGRAK